jgi:hypothetical protein
MILLKANQLNKIVVTLTENSTLCDPEYLFYFVHIFSKDTVAFIRPNISIHKERYDEFEFVEGRGIGEIAFPYTGEYNYFVYEQPMGSGNLDPLLATNLVENGISMFIEVSKDTTNEYFIEFISDDEFDSNVIFAPDEINPPSPTPSNTVSPTTTPTPTQTPTQTQTPTTTPTPTLTPTPSSTPPSAFDPDAAAYLEAVLNAGGTGITTTVSGATDTLFTELKTNGLYSKIKVMYPIIGGVANSHAINAVNLTANTLTYINTINHSLSGMTASGVAAANTGFNMSSNYPGNDMTFGAYVNSTPSFNDNYIIGAFETFQNFVSWDYRVGAAGIDLKYTQNTTTYRIDIDSDVENAIGFTQATSDGTGIIFRHENILSATTLTGAIEGTGLPNLEMYICNLNLAGTPYRPQEGRVCFAYIGDYMDSSELSLMSSIVNNYQTSLQRNTY